MKKTVSTAILACAVFTTNALATVIVGPVAGTASSEFSSDFDIGNTFDQSGLSIGYTSGVDDFDAYLALNPTHSYVASGNEWFTALGIISATITYDLGGLYSLDRMVLWNDEASGLGLFDISVSVDNITFTTVASALAGTDNPQNADYGYDIFSFGTHDASYVRLDISNCPQLDNIFYGCGMGEIAFSASAASAPEPTSLALIAIGLLGLVGIKRRKQ